ncbi:hypothetical protein [Paractinoplanes rishiriensis]|uniref:Uncharacterized protein n=1 Tax=Paractinoplanes rishiriensis TaxID=1050105 RepID=A0A919MTD7_9ACTN|nr:hypothetical protein [Actinoplanes rishiriensis]GIE94643.1 hypothetical protein Ari01nite_21080 [Actinoplanes rishiriensis]
MSDGWGLLVEPALDGIVYFLAILPGLLVFSVAMVVFGGMAGRILRRGGRLRGKYLLTVLMCVVFFLVFTSLLIVVAPVSYGRSALLVGLILLGGGGIASGIIVVLGCACCLAAAVVGRSAG